MEAAGGFGEEKSGVEVVSSTTEAAVAGGVGSAAERLAPGRGDKAF